MSISLTETGGGQVRRKTQPEIKSKSIPALAELAKNYTFKEIEQQVRAGKSAVWGGASWEAPLIRACERPVASSSRLTIASSSAARAKPASASRAIWKRRVT